MFTKFISGAEQEIEEVYRYASGAEQEADGVYTVKSGAEEEIWTNKKYFMRDGVFVNGGAYSDQAGFNDVASVENGYYTITNFSGNTSQLILKFPTDSKFDGKTLYVIVGDRPYLLYCLYNDYSSIWLEYDFDEGAYTCNLPPNSNSYYYLNFEVQNYGDNLSIKDIYVK